MKSLRIFFVLILGTIGLANSASATLITSFVGGGSLADNGLTLTQGFVTRATIETSVSSSTSTLTATEGIHLLQMIAGTEFDIINPAHPEKLVTLVTFNDAISINRPYFLVDFAFMGRDATLPRNDRQLMGINGTLYDIFGATETGYAAPRTLGWQTLAIHFPQSGNISLSLGCLNDTLNAGSSYCLWDNFRTADFVPTFAENNGIPTIMPIGDIDLPPIAGSVPEPETWSMVLLGLFLTGLMGRARNQHPA
jgi:hypothetical protein